MEQIDEEEIHKGVLEIAGVNKEEMKQIHQKREQAHQQIKELIQKPQVTEEWIEEEAKKLLSLMHQCTHFSFNTPTGQEERKDFIRSLIEEIGCPHSVNKIKE